MLCLLTDKITILSHKTTRWLLSSSSEKLSSMVCKIFMALFAHSSYALRQLELFNVLRNVDFNLRASLPSQFRLWLVDRFFWHIHSEDCTCSERQNDEGALKKPADKPRNSKSHTVRTTRGELSYLAPLGSENISAPYFKQCFFRGGWYYPPRRLSQTPRLPVPRQK